MVDAVLLDAGEAVNSILRPQLDRITGFSELTRFIQFILKIL